MTRGPFALAGMFMGLVVNATVEGERVGCEFHLRLVKGLLRMLLSVRVERKGKLISWLAEEKVTG